MALAYYIQAGQYRGCMIDVVGGTQNVYILAAPKIYLSKDNVTSVQLLNGNAGGSAGAAIAGGIAAGTVGAIAASNHAGSKKVVQITWKNGTTSTALVSNKIFNALLICTQNELTKNDEERIDSKNREGAICALVFIVFIIICYVIGSS